MVVFLAEELGFDGGTVGLFAGLEVTAEVTCAVAFLDMVAEDVLEVGFFVDEVLVLPLTFPLCAAATEQPPSTGSDPSEHFPVEGSGTPASVLSVAASSPSVETIASSELASTAGATFEEDPPEGDRKDSGSNPITHVTVSRSPPRLNMYAMHTEQKNIATALKTIMGSFPLFPGGGPP